MARNLTHFLKLGGGKTFRIIRFREQHGLGAPPEAEVDVLLEENLELAAIVGQHVTLEFGWEGDEPRAFHGIVESASLFGTGQLTLSGGRTYQYTLRIVSRLALLSRDFGCEIFQDKDVKAIVTKVLEDRGIGADLVEWRLTGSYVKREYCVRYQETALAFVTRLLEDEGIFYFVEPGDEDEKIVFADDSTAAAPMTGDATLVYRHRSGTVQDTDAIYAVHEAARVVSGAFVLRDFNFEKPQLDLTCTAKADASTDLEVYDYPGRYTEAAEGRRRADVRLQAEQAARRTVTIDAQCPRLAAGRKITIDGSGTADGDYVVTSVTHDFVDREQRIEVRATASLVPADVKFRLRTATPWPVIEGPQTARVVCPAGSQGEEIHTDKHGRVKVKFQWDTTAVDDDKATFWMRTQQLQTSGSMVLPRVEWEVIVEFLEGNPDRPIVTGRLYNGATMPPYALPEGKTRTSMQSASSPGGGGTNEIRMEDKAGAEEVMIHAQYDVKMVTANNKKKNVGNNETSVIKANSTLEVGANQDVKITKGNQNTVGGSQSVSVGGNRSVEVNAVTGLTVTGDASTSVGGNQNEMDGNPLEGLIAVAAERAAEFLAAKAADAIGAVQGAVQARVGQVMGPINNVVNQANAIGSGMQAVANGDLGAAAGLTAAAAGIPGASALGASLGSEAGSGPSGGFAATTTAPGAQVNAMTVAAGSAMRAMATNAIQSGVSGAASALSGALGLGGGGGGGQSMANAAGPEGAVSGIDETDRAKGPGHSINNVTGTHTEKIGSLKVLAALNGLNLNVKGAMTQDVSAAHVEVVIGSRAESVEGAKTEKALGLVVLSKGGESEKISGSKTQMVGGAILEKVGSHAVQATGNATFIGAFHSLTASSAIVLKCGGSEVVIDGGGVTMTSAMITLMGGKIQIPKATTES